MIGTTGAVDVVPTISLLDGEVVVVRGKKYERLEDEKGRLLRPAVFVEQVLREYKHVLLLDINGIESNRPQLELIRELSELGEVWVDPGIRNAESMIDVLVAGASALVLGTKTLAGVDQLKAAFEMSENIYLSIDYNKSVVSGDEQIKHMSPRSLADIARNIGIKKLLFTDLGRRATSPLSEEEISKLTKGPLPLYVGGAVMEPDLAPLAALGAQGALLSVLSIVKEAD